MPAEWVFDASAAIKCFITEAGSEEARQIAASAARLTAPEFVFAEIASVTVKRSLRGDIDRGFAEEIVARAPELFDETPPVGPLAAHAQAIALDHGVSVYDALYLALAASRDTPFLTADAKLTARLSSTPFAQRIRLISMNP